MQRVLVLVLLLAMLPVAAQEPEPGPDVVVLAYHPFPDDADPLGFAFGKDCSRACDAFVVRHGAREPFTDGVAFPGFAVDGVERMEGLGNGEAFDATVAMYDAAVEARLGLETPITLSVATRVVEGEVRASVWIDTSTSVGDGLSLWVALVEDPVHYVPPPALSNGVHDHPFTVRAVRDMGSVTPAPGAGDRVDLSMPLDEAWEPSRMRMAAWVEQGRGALGTFEPGEVVQAASHALLSSGITRQVDRAVLVEAYSASWCDPCLIGDEALEEVAQRHGLSTGRSLADASRSYLRDVSWPLLAVAAAAGAALFAMPRLGGRP